MLLLFVGLSFYKMNSAGTKPRDMSAVEFRRALDSGAVEDPLERVISHDEGTTYLSGRLKVENKEKDGGKRSVPFRVYLVPGESEKLMNDLADRSVNVKVRNESSALSPLVMNLLFFGATIFLFYWLFARRLGGDGGPFGMGKSRAKMLTGKEEKKRATFADVAGIDEAKEEVQEIVEFLRKPDDFRKLGGRIPKGILLVGPPGTGKTLLARAIAGEAGVPFFAISGSDFEEMFVGVGASRMRDMFAEAKKRAPCIVFIDEVDSIGMKRTGAGAMGGSHAYEQTLNTMLVEMDGFDANEGVIVIAATNRPDTLDSALLRPGRFDRQVMVDLPTLKGREEILALHGRKIKFASDEERDADLRRVARGTPGFSGADLANLLNEAALMAVRKKLDAVDMATLDEARDKVLWGRERKSAGYSRRDREITAWHESGHALLQLLLRNTDPLHKVTIIPRGRALGATMSLPERDILNRTKAHFLDELVVTCGGRIAEKLFTGELSTGAAQDIAQATDIARKMICTYGMSEKFGFQSFREPSQFSAGELPPAFSEETSRAIDAEVSKLVSDAYARGERLIAENRDRLETLANALLDRETMDGRDVEELLGIRHEEEARE
ncbi:MAG: ATP-dependent zinc metalloprotease FtsH [Kiritimatiellae bacterium]|nr:ATP-dependent zinc metalloprotease FtsH [Kiritimatiellia bacterium]